MDRPGSTLTFERTPSASQRVEQHVAPLRDRRRFLALHVRHTEAAAEHQLGKIEGHGEVGHDLGRLGERRRLEHVRADVAVQPHQFDRRRSPGPVDRPQRIAVAEVEPELRVVLPGGDELVRVGVDARRDPQQDLGRRSGTRRGERVEAIELVERIDHDVAHAGGDRHPQLGQRLVVAVQGTRSGRDTGGQRDVEFPSGGDVEQQPLVVREPGHRRAQEGFRRVDHALMTERSHRLLAAGAQVRLVVHEQRCPEVGGEVGDRTPPDRQRAVRTDRRRVRQQPPWDRAQRPDRPASDERRHRMRGFGSSPRAAPAER